MIKQFKDEAIQTIWDDYSSTGAPTRFKAAVDALAWGKSANLWLLATDIATGEKFRFSTYFNNNYAPPKTSFSLRDVEIKQHLDMATKNVNGRHVLTGFLPITFKEKL